MNPVCMLLWLSISPGLTLILHSRGACRDPRRYRSCQKDTHYEPSQPGDLSWTPSSCWNPVGVP